MRYYFFKNTATGKWLRSYFGNPVMSLEEAVAHIGREYGIQTVLGVVSETDVRTEPMEASVHKPGPPLTPEEQLLSALRLGNASGIADPAVARALIAVAKAQ